MLDFSLNSFQTCYKKDKIKGYIRSESKILWINVKSNSFLKYRSICQAFQQQLRKHDLTVLVFAVRCGNIHINIF